jgi:hypothetical protein
MIGGLCLLLPRAGAVGALMLAAVVVGSAGLTIGQVATKATSGATNGTVQTYQAVGQSGEFRFQQPVAVTTRNGIDI